MAICNMMVQQVLGRECLWTILARVDEQSRKVNILNVLPQIGLVGTDFSTEGAFECLLSIFQVADNIIVKSLVATCKRQNSSTAHFYYVSLIRACSRSS